jgi:hypothetical protein
MTAPVLTQNATITLSAPAPEFGLRFTLAASILGSSDRGATVPAEVRVAQGQTSVDFQIAFNPVSARRQVTLTASGLGTQRKDMTINVDPAPSQQMSPSPFGQPVIGKQTPQVATGAATGGAGGGGGNPFTSDSLVDSVGVRCRKMGAAAGAVKIVSGSRQSPKFKAPGVPTLAESGVCVGRVRGALHR